MVLLVVLRYLAIFLGILRYLAKFSAVLRCSEPPNVPLYQDSSENQESYSRRFLQDISKLCTPWSDLEGAEEA